MNTFFTQLSAAIGQAEFQLNIKPKGAQITVMITPKTSANDPALANLQPLIITGTAEQLDADFITAITSPLQKLTGLISNLESFEASTKKTEEESRIKKAAEDKIKKEADEKVKKFDALTKKADGFEKDGKLKEAVGALKQAQSFAKDPGLVLKRINELTAKYSQNSLFGGAETEDHTDYLEGSDQEEEELINEDGE
jgi:PRTRC genetic system protein E